MQKLIDAGLWGVGLIEVDTPLLVDRYNKCLEILGIEPTKLDRFNIDGMGWSPEVSHEKGDLYYLSAGIANPMAIILSPDQKGKPIFVPYTSYDRAMMEDYFEKFSREITDITQNVAIGLDIDPELREYNHPRDLLLVDYVDIQSFAGDLPRAAKEQRDMISEFNNDLGWFDSALRERIIEHSKQYGDLRYRNLSIQDMRFTHVRTFYTYAFGGVFVIRCLKCAKGEKGILGLVRPVEFADEIGDEVLYELTDDLINRLVDENLLEIDVKYWKEQEERLEFIGKCLQAFILCSDSEIDFSILNPSQVKRFLKRSDHPYLKLYDEFSKAKILLLKGKVPSEISRELSLLLLRPKGRFQEGEADVLKRLLIRYMPIDIIRMYALDKDFFFEQYRNWPESFKKWAIIELKEKYVSKSTTEKSSN